MTDRWMRSPRGKIFGVATGLAEWKDLPAEPVRLIVFFTILFTGFFPGAIIYLIIALFLPLRQESDYYEPAGERKHTAGRYDHIYKNADEVRRTEKESRDHGKRDVRQGKGVGREVQQGKLKK